MVRKETQGGSCRYEAVWDATYVVLRTKFITWKRRKCKYRPSTGNLQTSQLSELPFQILPPQSLQPYGTANLTASKRIRISVNGRLYSASDIIFSKLRVKLWNVRDRKYTAKQRGCIFCYLVGKVEAQHVRHNLNLMPWSISPKYIVPFWSFKAVANVYFPMRRSLLHDQCGQYILDGLLRCG